jgi:PadR family transcriptional regulator PadR
MAARPHPLSIPTLRELELLVMLAVLGLDGEAHPVRIAEFLEGRTKRRVSRATVFITLERLERKGLVSSWYGDPTPVRGGRAKRFFKVESMGLEAVRQSVERVSVLTAGLEVVLARQS